MSLKYEKPIIISFGSDRDETGLGLCQPSGSRDSGNCNIGNRAGGDCKQGPAAITKCAPGVGT
jgi:hypothetical protein